MSIESFEDAHGLKRSISWSLHFTSQDLSPKLLHLFRGYILHIVEESRCPVVINFVVLDFSISKFLGSLSYYGYNIGLSLFFLKLNPLCNRRSKLQLALYGGVRRYQSSSSFGLSPGYNLHCLRLAFGQYPLRFYLSFCSYQLRVGFFSGFPRSQHGTSDATNSAGSVIGQLADTCNRLHNITYRHLFGTHYCLSRHQAG